MPTSLIKNVLQTCSLDISSLGITDRNASPDPSRSPRALVSFRYQLTSPFAFDRVSGNTRRVTEEVVVFLKLYC
ncbi:hypothetical protein TWF225_006915 [Orbilia oligospora]|nr:hypothetical protein TWF751_008349 [Orbilia oligospora]KAF3194368.1 hypothetical protein TWF225_006915 [Orbilia oligospora]KAF3296131.1 hypothetical protein TWF132_011596 [Orbilia oligospora]